MVSNLEQKLKLLPNQPGCYLMKDNSNKIIYVGKAKNLKKRVRSYFNKAHNKKTQLLVLEIADFEYIITQSEKESLILENNLIKKHTPKFNIKLIDDKSYPYIFVTNDEYPKIIVKRSKKINYNAFGPYPNSKSAYRTVEILNKIFPFRSNISSTTEAQINYHLGKQFLGIDDFENLSRDDLINNISKFLKGDNTKVLDIIKNKMDVCSKNLEYEKALEYKQLIESIKYTSNKQLVDLNDFSNRDIVTFSYNENNISIQILIMRLGKIVDNISSVFEYVGNHLENVMSYIDQIYNGKIYVDEILFSDNFDVKDLEVRFKNKFVIPKIGTKKKLIDFCLTNSLNNLNNYYLINKIDNDRSRNGLNKLNDMLNIKCDYIECFDNAFLFGENMISGMIVIRDSLFSKKEYRTFSHDVGSDDLSLMKNVIYRRYFRLLMEDRKMPNLILVDGSQNQVNAALEILTSLNLNIQVCGLKKNNSHKLEYLVYDNRDIKIDKSDDLYLFLAKISEEVHRFTISFHRKTKITSNFKSPLDSISGVGPTTRKKLLQHFESIEDIKNAKIEDLQKLKISKKIALAIKEGLN